MKTTLNDLPKFGKNATLDDIVFQNKNHEYGAFAIRKGYLSTVNKAFYLGSTLFVIAMGMPTIYAKLYYKDLTPPPILRDLINVNKTPPTTPPVELPPPPPIEKIPDVASSRLLPPEIVTEVDPAEELPPTQEEMVKAPPSDETNVGNPNDIAPVIDETPVKTIEPVEIATVEPEIFIVLEQQASYPGGLPELIKFLGKNLKYPSQAQRANVSGKVFLDFIVDRNGEISNVQVVKGIGFGCDEEAIRVVNAMPRWSPGKQSGRAVKSKFTLPIAFVLE